MTSFLVLGAGKLAGQILRKIEFYDFSIFESITGCFDDFKEPNTKIYKNLKVLGSFSDVSNFDRKNVLLIPAVGYNELKNRLDILNSFLKDDYRYQNLIFSDNILSKNIGIGNFVSPNSVIDVGCNIGNFNFFDISTSIGEDCEIGDGNYFSNSSVVCGNCKISDSNFVGANATFIDNIKVGSNCKINSSSLIHNDLENNIKYLEPRKHFIHESL